MRAILCNNGIHKAQIAGYLAKFLENAAGNQDDYETVRSRVKNCRADLGIQLAVLCDRPIVIESKYSKFHGYTLERGLGSNQGTSHRSM